MTTASPGALPAWRQRTSGEHRWPVLVAVILAIALQVPLPSRMVLGPWWLIPLMAVLLIVALLLINPGRIDRYSRLERALALTMVGVVSVGNALSALVLVRDILNGSVANKAGPLLGTGAAIYATNILVFSLWYWEFDRGGPALRALGDRKHADFMFPQMANPELAPPDWEPRFVDYLYLSFTNAAAFSPTDVMPLRGWAKMTMLAQSAVSLVLVALVVARAVNILH